jgi:hypothetical protein
MNNINENLQSSESQNKRIAAWLQAGNTITALEALNMFGCFRLASRITDLKQKFGLDIKTGRVITPTGKRVACYSLNTEALA